MNRGTDSSGHQKDSLVLSASKVRIDIRVAGKIVDLDSPIAQP
jgi:hypothetical protein